MSSQHPVEAKEPVAMDSDPGCEKSQTEAGELHVIPEIDPKVERKVVAKLDLFLTPVLFIVYLSCFIDRANIGKRLLESY